MIDLQKIKDMMNRAVNDKDVYNQVYDLEDALNNIRLSIREFRTATQYGSILYRESNLFHQKEANTLMKTAEKILTNLGQREGS